MVSVSPIRKGNCREKIAAKAQKVAENLLQESKNKDFDIRKFATNNRYYLYGAKLEGTTLGEKSASLKLLFGNRISGNRPSIFAVVKNGKVLGVKGFAFNEQNIKSIFEKLCQKGKIVEDELKFVKKQLRL